MIVTYGKLIREQLQATTRNNQGTASLIQEASAMCLNQEVRSINLRLFQNPLESDNQSALGCSLMSHGTIALQPSSHGASRNCRDLGKGEN